MGVDELYRLRHGRGSLDPSEKLDGSARYLGGLLQRFATWRDPIVPSLAAYNAGPNAVEQYGSVPPVPETSNYVIFVRLVWKELHSEASRYHVSVSLVRRTYAYHAVSSLPSRAYHAV